MRGQYRARGGERPGGARLPRGAGGPNESQTETFVAIKAEVRNWRWAGVPFYLRTGKRLPARVSEIVVQFKRLPHSIFPKAAGAIQPNRLIIRLQPDEGIRLLMMSKDPGPGGMRLKQAPLNLSFAEAFASRSPDAYERLLLDVVRGNATLFMRKDEVEAAWRWVDPIIAGWAEEEEPPVPVPGRLLGADRSAALTVRDGRTWSTPRSEDPLREERP